MQQGQGGTQESDVLEKDETGGVVDREGKASLEAISMTLDLIQRQWGAMEYFKQRSRGMLFTTMEIVGGSGEDGRQEGQWPGCCQPR